MRNLFSTFDPQSIFYIKLNWCASLLVLLLFPPYIFSSFSQSLILLKNIVNSVKKEFSSIQIPFSNPKSLLPFLGLFLFIVLNNTLGLFPYVFTCSSHIVFSLSLALPIWVGHIIFRISSSPNNFFFSPCPSRTPAALTLLMVIIELISSLIRPLTLSVRLAANMIAGHLLLSLLAGRIIFSNPQVLFFSLGCLLLLGILECGVRLIQSYVFRILSTLYVEEVNSYKF